MISKELAQDFLLNVETKKMLQTLENRIGTVNIFEILKTEKAEIRHSNVIAWLLDPLENHKLSTKFIEVFFMNVANVLKNKDCFNFSDFILHGLEDVTIYRENNNIDILIVSKLTRQVIAIENKTGSQLHGSTGYVSQLDKYKDYLDKKYPNHEKLLLYLDSNLSFAEDIGQWRYINYTIIEDSLQFCLNDDDISHKTKLILGDYLENIRRNLMETVDLETQKLCNEIYKKYKEVIDFIASNKANTTAKFHTAVKEFLIENAAKLGIEILPDWCSSSYTRFRIDGLGIESEYGQDIWVKNQLMLFEISGDPTNEENLPRLRLITCAGKNKDNKTIIKIWDNVKAVGRKGEKWRTVLNEAIDWKGDLDDAESLKSLGQEIEDILKKEHSKALIESLGKLIGEK